MLVMVFVILVFKLKFFLNVFLLFIKQYYEVWKSMFFSIFNWHNINSTFS